MNIQDYLYFSPGDRRALSIIFVLILVGWMLFYVFNPPQPEPVVLAPVVQAEDSVQQRHVPVPDTSAQAKSRRTPASKPKPEPRSFYQPYISEKFPKGTVVELNSADSTTLRRVPGIGPVFASRIVRFRSLLGGFYTVSQLREVYGIDEERYRSLAPWFRVDTTGIVPLRVNRLSYKQLASHPYLSKAQVRSLCSLRALKRQLSGWGDLSLLEEFAAPQHRRLRHYLSFE